VTLDATRENGSLYLRYGFKNVLLASYQEDQGYYSVSFFFDSMDQIHYDAEGKG
jgi:hypothetical protein